ncbi:DUF5684 domain-containing protein [Oscillospiraceae bacterium PP1C4]
MIGETSYILLLAGIVSFGLVVMVLFYSSCWILFSKAGEPGWASIVPIYNMIVYYRIGGNPWYWILFMFIPFANIYFGIKALNDFLKVYGKGGTGSVLLALFFGLFYLPYLAFSKNVKCVV